MRFDLEDKRKIELICELLKALSSGRQTVLLVWHRTEGWAILQNPEYLDNLDSSNMVNLCLIRSHFFGHVVGEGKEHMCFELDISSLSRVLKSVKYAIKKMVWSATLIQGNNNNNNPGESQNHNQQGATQTQQQQQQPQSARLQLFLFVEEGQLEVSAEIGTVLQVNPQIYFRIFREFTEDKTQYLEIRQSYLQQLQDLKRNQCVFFRFYDGFVSAYNEEQENNISIKNTALNHYDFNQIYKNLKGKNLLTIPPNFLVPQVMIGLKLKDPIQLLIGDDIVDDHVCVSLRTKSDSFTFISQFKSIIELDLENRRNDPFEIQRLLQEHLRKEAGESQFHTAKQDLPNNNKDTSNNNNNNMELNSNVKNHQDLQQQQMSDSQFFGKDTQTKKESKLQQPSTHTREKEIIKTSSNKQYEVHKSKEFVLDQGQNNQNDQEISFKKENTSQKKQQQQQSSKSQSHKYIKESQLQKDNTTSQIEKDYEFYGKMPSQANNTSTRLNSQAMKEIDYQAGLMDGPGIGVSQIQSAESHIQGLTNNMQLADKYRQDPLMSLPLESQSNLFNANNTQSKAIDQGKAPQGNTFDAPQSKSQKSQRKLFKNSEKSGDKKQQQQQQISQQISQQGGKDDSVVFGVSQNIPQGNNSSNFGVTSSHITPVINQVPSSTSQASLKASQSGKNNVPRNGQVPNNSNGKKNPPETTAKKRKNGKQQLTLDESTRKIVHKDNGDQDKLLHRTDLLSNPTLSQNSNNNNNNAHSFSSFLNNKKEKDFSIFKLDNNLTAAAAALSYQ